MAAAGAGGSSGGVGKPTPNLDLESARQLNLTVLQRLDPAVEEILITAAHVTLYDFDLDLNQWSRKDVEGSLFVVKRNAQPRFQFIVMNRRNTDNLVEDLLGDFEYELQAPYILYRNASQEVNGIWFYNAQDCEAVANLFSRILNAYSKVPPKPKLASTKSEFEELEVVPTLSTLEGPLEPPTSSAATQTADVPTESFAAYFSAAATISDSSNPAVRGQPHQLYGNTHVSAHAPSFHAAQPPVLRSSSPLQTPSVPTMPVDTHDSTGANITKASDPVKPLFLSPLPSSSQLMMPPVASSSLPTAPPLHPQPQTNHPQGASLLPHFRPFTPTPSPPYGTPLLQPFPPPNPSPSLTPASANGPLISRDSVRNALLKLVQSDAFVDMVYQEIVASHSC